MRRLGLATVLALSLAALLSVEQKGYADGGDFSMDFTAAAPFSYDHDTGGGAYNDRTVGRFNDIVESLEGGDYACRDIVTFLTQITVDGGAQGTQAVRLNFEFTAHSTGQQGTALVDNDDRVPPAGISASINQSGVDSGTVDDGGSTASVLGGSEGYGGLVFVKPTKFFRSVDVTDLEAGEKVVLRTDVSIACNGQSPTGNMQARLASASVISGAGGSVIESIPAGDQTVPFKRVGDIKPPACDPKTDPNCK
jgi:hypothetical protein